MTSRINRLILSVFIIIGFSPALFGQGLRVNNSNQSPMNLTPEQKIAIATQIINNYYVEETNTDSLVQEGIKAMLKTLDPHSVYSNPEETKELTTPLEGKFSGIGIQFNMSTDTVYVIQPTSGGPSQKVGIQPGDRIIYANDTLIAGQKLTNSKIIKILRGPKGSKIKLKVKRPSVKELLEFVVTRDDIPVYSVDAAYMIDDKTGYISITRFADETGKEVAEALDKLSKQGMKKLVLDLQDNGGGYLGAAGELASLFLPKGSPIVSTKGLRAPETVYDNPSNGKYLDLPLVVAVNQYSASSSEIFAGAMQDNDRGLVVGRRTYGKGLVQRPFPFPDGSMIRLTTQKYYTPSGRSIQKHYDKGKGEEYYIDMLNRYSNGELWTPDSIHLTDSTRYVTLRNGRNVYGGGGILPDVFVPADTSYYSPYYRDLVAKGSLNRYVLDYVDHHRKALLKKYPSEDTFTKGFEPDEGMEKGLIAAGKKDSVEFVEKDWQRSLPVLKAMMKGLIERDLYDNGSYTRAVNHFNPIYQEAVRLVNNEEEYESLLKGRKPANSGAEKERNYLLLREWF